MPFSPTLPREGGKVKGKAFCFHKTVWYNENRIMPEKKSRPVLVVPETDTSVSEILVSRSRTLDPYFHLFSVSPENVTQEPLGRLMGVFSVSDHSDSSAYLGNAIASVARKEYFTNPRRGAIESFESALHRVNLSLAELVKDGQTRWMGRLHGAMAIIEKGNIHFSVTGGGSVLLYRDGVFSVISEGLASEEASTHPVKTFVEISSGRLQPNDALLLTTPELFSLLSVRELGQNARRLVPEGKYARFLETAMQNELRAGSVLVVSVTESAQGKPREETKRRTSSKARQGKPSNFFSAEVFRKAEEQRAQEFLEKESIGNEDQIPDPVVDEPRSGTIYVDGDAPPEKEEHPFITGLRWKSEDMRSTLGDFVARSAHIVRVRSYPFLSGCAESVRHTCYTCFRKITVDLRHAKEIRRKDEEGGTKDHTAGHTPRQIATRQETSAGSRKTVRNRISIAKNFLISRRLPVATTVSVHGKRMLSSLRAQLPHLLSISDAVLSALADRSKRMIMSVWERFLGLPIRHRLIIACVLTFFLTFLGITTRNTMLRDARDEPIPVLVTEMPAPPFPPEGEPYASLIEPLPVAAPSSDIIAPIFLGTSVFLVTKTGIFDAETGETFFLPSETAVSRATGMSDLGLIFLLTDSGDIFSFAPSNRTFSKNTVPLPPGSQTVDIGSFLTYLYLLDGGSGTIRRFPRTEGGFGEGVIWNKDDTEYGPETIAVSENIYGTKGTDIVSFFRGRPTEDFALERPSTDLSITALCADPDIPDLFVALDEPANRIILYERTGKIIRQYFSTTFKGATDCSLAADGTTIAVSSPSGASTFRTDR